MKTLQPLHTFGGRPGASLFRIVLVLTSASLAMAQERPGPDRSACPADLPPAFPDAAHVTRGCYLSTMAYIVRFTREFPDERAVSLTVNPAGFDGPHTIAVMTWRDAWWARDEFSGVFPLGRRVVDCAETAALRTRAQVALGRLARQQLARGRIEAGSSSRNVSAMHYEQDIRAAATLLPCASQCYRVRCGTDDRLFLFFRPAEGRIALYDPATGTASAECTPIDVPALVRQVAIRLGYAASRVQPMPLESALAED